MSDKNQVDSYEPKRKNQFKVKLPEEFGIPDFAIFKCDKPKISRSASEYEFNSITLTIADPIAFDIPNKIMLLLDKFKNQNYNEIFDLIIEIVDPTGVVVETWIIGIYDILSVDFGELSWNSDNKEISEIKMVLQPAKCEIKKI